MTIRPDPPLQAPTSGAWFETKTADPARLPRPAIIFFDNVLTDDLGGNEFDQLNQGTYKVYAGVWGRRGQGFSLVSPFGGSMGITAQLAVKSANHVANLSLLEMVNDGVVDGEVVHEDGLNQMSADRAMITPYCYEGAELVMVHETATNPDDEFALSDVKMGNYTVTADKVLNAEGPIPLKVSAESEAFFATGRMTASLIHSIERSATTVVEWGGAVIP